MIKLNDYLYSGDTVLRILYKYTNDLKAHAEQTGNLIDDAHCDFLKHITDLLIHNEFLTSQSQRIREFYKYMAHTYPELAFTFKGRIKSLVRAETKFNAYIVSFVYDYFNEHGEFPPEELLRDRLEHFRDLIAYRIVIAMPRCHLKNEADRETVELKYLYEIANALPAFLEERGFTLEAAEERDIGKDTPLSDEAKPYYRDYIANPSPFGYRSLHITVYDNMSHSYMEVQLRTKDMDDDAEIGIANHMGYEKRQVEERSHRDIIPEGKLPYFDEAFERVRALQNLELNELDVNMFRALNNSLINDGCGLFIGRLILPFEHLSRFQNDSID